MITLILDLFLRLVSPIMAWLVLIHVSTLYLTITLCYFKERKNQAITGNKSYFYAISLPPSFYCPSVTSESMIKIHFRARKNQNRVLLTTQTQGMALLHLIDLLYNWENDQEQCKNEQGVHTYNVTLGIH